MYVKELRVQYAATKRKLGKRVSEPQEVYTLMKLFGALKYHIEKFWVLHLDAKHRVKAIQEVGSGGIAGLEISPREIYSGALVAGSKAIIAVHNHPSGSPSPSSVDKELTFRLWRVSELLDVSCLDHMIVAETGYWSARQELLSEYTQYKESLGKKENHFWEVSTESIIIHKGGGMNKEQVEKSFKSEVLPWLKERYEENGKIDYSVRKEAWNTYVDQLTKEGKIKSSRVENWVTPRFCVR